MTPERGATRYLSIEDVLGLARLLLGDPAPVRDIGLLGSAAARPQATAFGQDAYADIWTKAAALLHSVVNDHALIDGNERLGWLSTAVFLELNGLSVAAASNDSIFELVMAVAADGIDVPEIASRLESLGSSGPGSGPGRAVR